MFSRTKLQKDEGKHIWQEHLTYVESLPAKLSDEIKQTTDYKEVVSLHKKQPMQHGLSFFVGLATPFLAKMNFKILETKISPGFITSDNPCFLYDPDVFVNQDIKSWHHLLSSPTVMILLPVSPNFIIQLEWHGIDSYITLESYPESETEMLNIFNNFTATNCDEFIVVNQNTFEESWFN